MCTRFQQYQVAPRLDWDAAKWAEDFVGQYFGIEVLPSDFTAQANISITDPALIVTNSSPHQADMHRFGLMPKGVTEKSAVFKSGYHNARSEEIESKYSFKYPFAERRCLIPATAFYDWKDVDGTKIPYGISVAGEPAFCMAGIWDGWIDEKTQLAYKSFSIITCEPNELVKPIHKRMPVILPAESYEAWLQPSFKMGDKAKTAELKSLLQIFPAEKMVAIEYDRYMSNTKNKDASKIMPLRDVKPDGQQALF